MASPLPPGYTRRAASGSRGRGAGDCGRAAPETTSGRRYTWRRPRGLPTTMDPVAWLSFLGALAATIGAVAAARRRDPRVPLLLLFLAALLLHGNLAWHEGLGRWDERFHALVARNLLDHPLVPTLLERPLYDSPASDWFNSHVWLHKPPLATWLMAGSMALFGENEFALRLPSVLLSAACVVLTFLIARLFLGATAALLAAARNIPRTRHRRRNHWVARIGAPAHSS